MENDMEKKQINIKDIGKGWGRKAREDAAADIKGPKKLYKKKEVKEKEVKVESNVEKSIEYC